ncbi:MAG: YcxB family protein [Lachnospiraceae bacterium]|nr:YcxB family protein [Lachnospiraceae bacterium]
MKEVKFSVKIQVKDMFLFLLRHSYRGVQLIVDIIITVGAIALLVAGFGKDSPVTTFVLVVLALLFTVINPLQLYSRAKKQVTKNEVFAKPLNYVLTNEGITMSQGEVTQSFAWGDIYQIKEYKSMFAVYTGRVYACIWPKRELAACENEVRELFRKHLSEQVAGKSIK